MSVTLLSWDVPGPYAVAFSTRLGGVSEGSFDSLNLGLMTHDEPANVQENRRRLCEAAGADSTRLAMNRQVHAATVNRAEAGERGREGDGLWTDEPGIPMLKLTAD
jgi:copper oxidase (laccase) domain-containing protein